MFLNPKGNTSKPTNCYMVFSLVFLWFFSGATFAVDANELAKVMFNYSANNVVEDVKNLIKTTDDANQVLEMAVNQGYKDPSNDFVYYYSLSSKQEDLVSLALAKGAQFSAIDINWYSLPSMELAKIMLENPMDTKNTIDPSKFLNMISTASGLEEQKSELIALAVSKGAVNKATVVDKHMDDYDKNQIMENLAGEIYSLFGVETSSKHDTGFDVRLNNKNHEEVNKVKDQIAKLHIISALINNNDSSYYRNILLENGKVVVNYPYMDLNNSNVEVKELYDLMNLKKHSDSAYIFLHPYNNYTLSHSAELVRWLDESWDESKIEAMIKQSGIDDADRVFNILKLRWQNLKILLAQATKQHRLYDSVKIQQEKVQKSILTKEFKSISYEPKTGNSLPIAQEQIVFYYNDSEAWLELTNYEFLINGKESNELVTVYIGKSAAAAKNAISTAKFTKKSIEIFDPESAFIFQHAILRYLDQDKQNIKTNLCRNLAEVFQAGYSALSYHFELKGLSDDAEAINSISSIQALLSFIESRHGEYKNEAIAIDRYITVENIADKAKLGFVAYYPNPCYLHDIAWYIRPEDMSYFEYKNYSNFHLAHIYEAPEILLKKVDKNASEEYNEYYEILKRVYPDKKLSLAKESCPLKDNVYEYKYSDLKSLTYRNFKALPPVYVFRGDDRTLEDIFLDQGFKSPLARGCKPNGYDYSVQDICEKHGLGDEPITEDQKELMKKIKTIDDFWRVEERGTEIYTNKAYISASKSILTARNFGSNIYVLSAKKGIEIPKFLDKGANGDSYHFEVAIPMHVKTEDIVGTRTSDTNGHMIGPVFLSNRLAADDIDNFWKIIQLFGGKPQSVGMSSEQEATVMQFCEDTFNELYTKKTNSCEKILTTIGAETTTAKAECLLNDKAAIEYCFLPKEAKFQVSR